MTEDDVQKTGPSCQLQSAAAAVDSDSDESASAVDDAVETVKQTKCRSLRRVFSEIKSKIA